MTGHQHGGRCVFLSGDLGSGTERGSDLGDRGGESGGGIGRIEASRTRRTSAVPTMIPSPTAAALACSGVEIPTPNTIGASVTARIRSASDTTWELASPRSPVTPISATA
jgi:hypothetical protein